MICKLHFDGVLPHYTGYVTRGITNKSLSMFKFSSSKFLNILKYRSVLQVSIETVAMGNPARNNFVTYRKTSNISRTLVGNKIVDNSDVIGASPIGAAPTTSSFST